MGDRKRVTDCGTKQSGGAYLTVEALMSLPSFRVGKPGSSVRWVLGSVRRVVMLERGLRAAAGGRGIMDGRRHRGRVVGAALCERALQWADKRVDGRGGQAFGRRVYKPAQREAADRWTGTSAGGYARGSV